ncbi:MAG: hypothetical protein GY814_07080 [Gammaproteobacteria bacterium]|nr:hypothetical protein [Gammaproteobacteria bacterium]
MKAFARAASILVLGLIMGADALAFYADGSNMKDDSGAIVGDYLGYMGSINNGVQPIPGGSFFPAITSLTIPAGGAVYLPNGNASFTNTAVAGVHWYSFTLDTAKDLDLNYEFGDDLEYVNVSFFHDTSEVAAFSQNYLNADPSTNFGGHMVDPATDVFSDTGTWWMRIEGKALTGANGSVGTYKVQPATSTVPLPPAILLFVSALAGLGVMGRTKKRQRSF